MPLPVITAEDLKLSLVEALANADPVDLKDVTHAATCLPAAEVHDALLKAARYARTIALRRSEV